MLFKICYRDKHRLFSPSQTTYAALHSFVISAFTLLPNKFFFTYLDCEQDQVTLCCQADMVNLIEYRGNGQPSFIRLQVKTSEEMSFDVSSLSLISHHNPDPSLDDIESIPSSSEQIEYIQDQNSFTNFIDDNLQQITTQSEYPLQKEEYVHHKPVSISAEPQEQSQNKISQLFEQIDKENPFVDNSKRKQQDKRQKYDVSLLELVEAKLNEKMPNVISLITSLLREKMKDEHSRSSIALELVLTCMSPTINPTVIV